MEIQLIYLKINKKIKINYKYFFFFKKRHTTRSLFVQFPTTRDVVEKSS